MCASRRGVRSAAGPSAAGRWSCSERPYSPPRSRTNSSSIGLTIHAVIDNNPDKIGRNYQGLTVQHPEAVLVPHRDDYVVIVVAVTAAREMLHQMESLGYRKRRQAFILSPTKLDESRTAFLRAIQDVLRGSLSYRKLIGRDRESTLFIAPYAGTGDIYLICLYLKSFVERENIPSYTLAVASNACAQVARMMGESRCDRRRSASAQPVDLLWPAQACGDRTRLWCSTMDGWAHRRSGCADSRDSTSKRCSGTPSSVCRTGSPLSPRALGDQ